MLESLLSLDSSLLVWVQNTFVVPWLTPIMIGITHMGDAGLCWIGLCFGLVLYRKTRRTGLVMSASLLGSFVICNILLKNIVARVRPYEILPAVERLIEQQSDFSFPSGHTSISFAAAVVVLCLCPCRYGLPCILFATLMGFTRLYLGVHYPLDVLVGLLLGSGIALLSVCIYRKYWDIPLV